MKEYRLNPFDSLDLGWGRKQESDSRPSTENDRRSHPVSQGSSSNSTPARHRVPLTLRTAATVVQDLVGAS